MFYKTKYVHEQFLSTPSARRATSMSCGKAKEMRISIHALREEGDLFVFQNI